MHRITNNNLYICFNCEGERGFYNEFEDYRNYQNPPCPNCRSHSFTLPLYYLEELTIPAFQDLMDRLAVETPWLPFLDLKFKTLRIGAIICSHKITG